MLVLSRKVGERILVGNSVVITVLGTRGSEIRIGIEAPESCIVLRQELETQMRQVMKPNPKR
jgi:carbon storage regulator